jgi:hypothetical protein
MLQGMKYPGCLFASFLSWLDRAALPASEHIILCLSLHLVPACLLIRHVIAKQLPVEQEKLR